ncbi:MAG: hypothetical protein HYZ57_20765 [Acidobacteria bacterium]|nr:hypothetical protein [Acidobacteriota bacterium]
MRRAVAQGKPLREVVEFLASDHLYVNPSMLVTFLGLHDVPRFLNEPGAAIEGIELAFTFLLTTRGIPLLYYGDEIGLPGAADPDNRRDFPGGWLTDPRNAFNAAERTPGERAVFDHVRRLAHFRKTTPALRRGRLVHLGVTEQQYVYARVLGRDAVIVALNNASTPAKAEFEPSALPLPVGTLLRDALGRAPDIRLRSTTALDLPARSGAVYVVGQ